MTCDDPDCPACQLEQIFTAFRDGGAEIEDVIPMVMALLGQVFHVELHTINVDELAAVINERSTVH
jgi:hypothetical protein